MKKQTRSLQKKKKKIQTRTLLYKHKNAIGKTEAKRFGQYSQKEDGDMSSKS